MMDYSNLKQVALPEEVETMVTIDYEAREFVIWTNKATLMRRICKAGYEPQKIGKFDDGSIYNMEWRLPTSEIGKFMRTSYFKFD